MTSRLLMVDSISNGPLG